MRVIRIAAMLGLALGLLLPSCGREPSFTEPQVLGGVEVAPEVLEQGKWVYRRYCATCHGNDGDGKGVTSFGQWPPPRDFRIAKFKFAGVQDRGLPSDKELRRIITQGLKGTYMRPWILRDTELNAVIQYIKTFSREGKGFRSKRLKVKPPEIPPDPYDTPEKIAAAQVLGEKLYHATFQCSSCHPAYVKAEKFSEWEATIRAADPFDSVPKYSENYRNVLLPPDFLRHDMRAVRSHKVDGHLNHRVSDLYRSVAFGLMGPMPGFGHLGAADVWAVSHYVKMLADKKDTVEGNALRRKLTQQ